MRKNPMSPPNPAANSAPSLQPGTGRRPPRSRMTGPQTKARTAQRGTPMTKAQRTAARIPLVTARRSVLRRSRSAMTVRLQERAQPTPQLRPDEHAESDVPNPRVQEDVQRFGGHGRSPGSRYEAAHQVGGEVSGLAPVSKDLGRDACGVQSFGQTHNKSPAYPVRSDWVGQVPLRLAGRAGPTFFGGKGAPSCCFFHWRLGATPPPLGGGLGGS